MSNTTHILRRLGAFVLLAMLVVAGCDSNGESDSDFAALEGTWTANELEVRTDSDGNFIDITEQLDARYDGGVVVTFFESDTQGRRFQMTLRSTDSSPITLSGDVQIDANDDEILLLPATLSVTIALGYEVTNTELVLVTDEEDGGDFLTVLFGNNPYGTFVEARTTLARGGTL